MILPSKECLLISSQENRQFFLFDPKTTAVLHKYRDDCFLSNLAYYPRSQQILGQQINKTFMNVWSYDSQQAEIRVSMNETMTALLVLKDSHFLIGGGITGNVYFWELPNGILIKKKMVHSTEIKHIIQYQNHHVITASKSEVKIWPYSSFFIQVDHSSPLKIYTSVLEIVAVAESRNILVVLTHKSVSFLQLSLQSNTKELQLIHKMDYQYVTALCLSNTSAFIGDAKGTVQVIQLITAQQQRHDLSFKIKEGTKQLQINKPKRKRVLAGTSKHPITVLAYVSSLSYLISGNSSGEIVVWNNYQIKKSLHLFKTGISHIRVIAKPKEQKIHQVNKLQPLNKYQLSKQQELLDIIPNYAKEDQEDAPYVTITNNQEAQEQAILYNMLSVLNEPQKILRQQVQRLKGQRKLLLQSNLHYFKLLSE